MGMSAQPILRDTLRNVAELKEADAVKKHGYKEANMDAPLLRKAVDVLDAAEALAKAAQFLLETDAGEVSPVDNNRIVGAGALADVRRALSCYEEFSK